MSQDIRLLFKQALIERMKYRAEEARKAAEWKALDAIGREAHKTARPA